MNCVKCLRENRELVLVKRGPTAARTIKCAVCGAALECHHSWGIYGTTPVHFQAGARCPGSDRAVCGECGALDTNDKVCCCGCGGAELNDGYPKCLDRTRDGRSPQTSGRSEVDA